MTALSDGVVGPIVAHARDVDSFLVRLVFEHGHLREYVATIREFFLGGNGAFADALSTQLTILVL